VQWAQRAAVHGGLGGGECGVEPALVADLHRHPGAGNGLGDLGALGRGGRHRLLAERRQPTFDGGQRQFGVRRRRSGDNDTVDTRREQRVDRINGSDTVFRGNLRGDVGALVGDDETVHPR
jgi:hypothetical protein